MKVLRISNQEKIYYSYRAVPHRCPRRILIDVFRIQENGSVYRIMDDDNNWHIITFLRIYMNVLITISKNST